MRSFSLLSGCISDRRSFEAVIDICLELEMPELRMPISLWWVLQKQYQGITKPEFTFKLNGVNSRWRIWFRGVRICVFDNDGEQRW